MSRGGRRRGMPGRNYSERLDLNQDRQPLLDVTPPAAPAPQAAQQAQSASPAPAIPVPGANTFAPTAFPNQPLTHGLSTGPGAGPEVLPFGNAPTDYVGQLRAIYQQYPTEALRDLIAFNSTGGA